MFEGGGRESGVQNPASDPVDESDRQPARSPEEYARLLEALDAGVFVLDPAGVVTFVNDDLCALTGYDPDRLVGATPAVVLADRTVADFEEAIQRELGDHTDSFTIDRHVAMQRADGTEIQCRGRMTVLRDDDGTILGSVGLLRDVSSRERRALLLSKLQETTQSLMQAHGRETIAEIVADTAVERLGFGACVVRLYDADARRLVPVAAAGDGCDDADSLPAMGLDDGPAAAVFTSGEPAVYADASEIDGGAGGRDADGILDGASVGGAAYHPIGTHGTLALRAGPTGTFDDVDRQITGLLATNAAAACNRARREREVRNAREHVATIVDRIEGLVEDTIEVLVGATTREDVERGVCERLAATAPYAAAWIARPDVRESALVPAEQAGWAELTLADDRIDLGTDTPAAVAYREGSSQVVEAAAVAEAESVWLAAARERGVAAVVAIPLVHLDAAYGVLFVCADRADTFDERELVVLEALGRAVADAIDAIESGRILEADEVVELSVAVTGGTVLDRVADAAGATLATAGTMSAPDGSLRLFLTATGAEADVVEAALVTDDAVAEGSLVADLEEECLFDVSLSDAVLADLVDRGAVPVQLAADGGETRLTVEVTDERAARETFTFLEERTQGASLVGYREHERPVRTRQEFRAALAERFTDRQETALRTAYHGGFFDWPRGADGEELADGMGISRPTYHQHLRAAQRKVFEELFEAESSLRE
jgi:PAS domain S-box-containing protein